MVVVVMAPPIIEADPVSHGVAAAAAAAAASAGGMVSSTTTAHLAIAASDLEADDDVLDLEAEIARFAGDLLSDSLALPTYLSAQQRQHAKMLVGRHQELESKTLGFGAERRMHIFRRCGGNAGGSPKSGDSVRMRVKNTFIHAWIAMEGVCDGPTASSAMQFRSLPADLQRQ